MLIELLEDLVIPPDVTITTYAIHQNRLILRLAGEVMQMTAQLLEVVRLLFDIIDDLIVNRI